MTHTFKVAAATLTVERLTLYSPEGGVLVIPQGDARVANIMNQLKEHVPSAANPTEVNISQKAIHTEYDNFSKNSSKKITFIRIAKKLLNALLYKEDEKEKTIEDVQPMSLGDRKVIDGIMSLAEPTGTNVHESTVVAVVDDVAIPGMENIHEQLKFANETGTKGVDAFLTRMAKVASERRHSAEDLLKFLKRGDLPIADDGSIIAYKLLQRNDNHYVDLHTKKVKQTVGDFVCMDPSLVNPDRRQDCSNGLHVARRDYLQRFDGNVCTLIKVAPEDVIAVPQYDGSKMRVCGYHIIKELPDDAREILQNNKPLTEHEYGSAIMADAIAGNHVGISRIVKIGGHKGTNITTESREVATPKAEPVKEVKALDESIDVVSSKVDTVQPSSLVQNTGGSQRVQEAQRLLRVMQEAKSVDAKKTAAEQLKAYKRFTKVSWDRLGITETEVALVEKAISG